MKRLFIIDTFLWSINILLALGLLLSWIAFYSPLNRLVVISFSGLLVPGLIIANLFFLIYWFIRRKKKAFFVLTILLFNFIFYGNFYGFGPTGDVTDTAKSLSIMSYNVRGLNHNEQLPIKNVDSAIFDFVIKERPDILCVQESHYAMKKTGPLDSIYKYKYVDFIYGVPATNVINSIYSKYPILYKSVIDFPNSNNTAMYADILMENDTIRIYNVHLQSFRVPPDVNYLQHQESGILYNRITQALKLQEEQAKIILDNMKRCTYPILVVGDLNNVQFSKVYQRLKEGRKDAFLEAGYGLGRTINFFGIPMRIDYILVDDSLTVTSFKNYNIELSDHYPVMAHIVLKSDE